MAKVMGNTLIKEMTDETLKMVSFKAICIACDAMLGSTLDPNSAMNHVKSAFEKSVEISRDEPIGFAIILFSWDILGKTSTGGLNASSLSLSEALKDIQDTLHAKLGKITKGFI